MSASTQNKGPRLVERLFNIIGVTDTVDEEVPMPDPISPAMDRSKPQTQRPSALSLRDDIRKQMETTEDESESPVRVFRNIRSTDDLKGPFAAVRDGKAALILFEDGHGILEAILGAILYGEIKWDSINSNAVLLSPPSPRSTN